MRQNRAPLGTPATLRVGLRREERVFTPSYRGLRPRLQGLPSLRDWFSHWLTATTPLKRRAIFEPPFGRFLCGPRADSASDHAVGSSLNNWKLSQGTTGTREQ